MDSFTQRMGMLQEKMFLKPPAPEQRLKPWTSADIAKFAASNPKAGADLNTLRNAGVLTGIGGLASAGLGGAFFSSRPGTVNGKVFSAVLGSIGSGLVGYLVWTNITTFTHGTYKIDPSKTNVAWQTWWRKNGGAGGLMYEY